MPSIQLAAGVNFFEVSIFAKKISEPYNNVFIELIRGFKASTSHSGFLQTEQFTESVSAPSSLILIILNCGENCFGADNATGGSEMRLIRCWVYSRRLFFPPFLEAMFLLPRN